MCPIHPPGVPPNHPMNLPPPPPSVETVYRVDMPPLTFDAKSPTPPPDPDPSTILLVRESRVAPEVFFRGHVEAVALPEPVAKSASLPPPATEQPQPKKPGLISKFFGLFRGKPKPCAGSGCGNSNP